jgi:hypothetical protein
MRKGIEVVTNVAILVVCGLLCWLLLRPHVMPDGKNEAANEASLRGMVMPSFPGYRWGDHPKTLVLAIREGCTFCEQSLPFYKRLSELETQGVSHAHLLAVMPDTKEAGEGALRSKGVSLDGVFGQSLSTMKVSGTPTLLLVDRDGRVTQSWIGLLNTEREHAVISAVGK